jgi:biopolymer transport protein ExbD
MARRDTPEINAGSMADIAFLLLIFFLVTTTMDVDQGISRRLPEKQPENVEPPVIKQRNIFEISINRNDDLLVENEYRKTDEIKELAIEFIDNGGAIGNPIESFGETEGTECTWCEGKKSPESSDHPNKAIIQIKTDRSTKYGTYVIVQNEVSAALTFLRDRLAKKEYGKTYTEMVKEDKNNKINPDQSLKDKISKIKVMYPEIITEQNN